MGDGRIIQIGHWHYKSPYKRGGGESEKKVGIKRERRDGQEDAPLLGQKGEGGP